MSISLNIPLPKAPDYSDISCWAHVPPEGAGSSALPCDVIYAPGTLLSGEICYYDVYNPDHRILAARPRKVQASIFHGVANVYQPHCRQVSMEVNLLPPAEMRAAYQVSYNDMRQAFLHYLTHWNKGRPFFLLGHSQGSILLLELLKDVMADNAIYRRLAAAYIIGFSVTDNDLRSHANMKIATRADDTGVIITYNTLAQDGEKAITLLPGAYCVNPLNWLCTAEYADKSLNMGRVDFDINGNISREYPHYTDAWINPATGALHVGMLANELETGAYFPAGDFHHYNFTFFYRNLAANAKLRAQSFLSLKEQEKA